MTSEVHSRTMAMLRERPGDWFALDDGQHDSLLVHVRACSSCAALASKRLQALQAELDLAAEDPGEVAPSSVTVGRTRGLRTLPWVAALAAGIALFAVLPGPPASAAQPVLLRATTTGYGLRLVGVNDFGGETGDWTEPADAAWSGTPRAVMPQVSDLGIDDPRLDDLLVGYASANGQGFAIEARDEGGRGGWRFPDSRATASDRALAARGRLLGVFGDLAGGLGPSDVLIVASPPEGGTTLLRLAARTGERISSASVPHLDGSRTKEDSVVVLGPDVAATVLLGARDLRAKKPVIARFHWDGMVPAGEIELPELHVAAPGEINAIEKILPWPGGLAEVGTTEGIEAVLRLPGGRLEGVDDLRFADHLLEAMDPDTPGTRLRDRAPDSRRALRDRLAGEVRVR